MVAKYIADLTEKAALVEADSVVVGDSTVTGAGSGKRHSPKQSVTASSLVLRTATGAIKAADGVDDDDLATMAQVSAAIASAPSGVIWDPNDDTYERPYGTTGVTSVHRAMRRCLLLDDGTVNYYLDPNDSTLKLDGTAADLSGADGQVMVEIPLFYARYSEIAGGVKPIQKREVSAVPLAGFTPYPAFCIGGTFEREGGQLVVKDPDSLRSYIYIGAYDACMYDDSASAYVSGLNLDDMTPNIDLALDILSSVSGVYPLVGVTRAECRTLAANRGAGWCQQSFWVISAVQWLFSVEYGDFKSQQVVGNGNVSVAGGYLPQSSLQTDSPHSVAGKSNTVGNGTGAVASTARDTAWMSYRGIENFWGNCWNFVDGVNIIDGAYFVSNDLVNFADNTTVNYFDMQVTAPVDNGYISDVFGDTLSFIPKESLGSSSSYFADFYYYGSGNRVLRLGGVASYGAGAGGFCWSGSGSSGGAVRDIGARVVFLGG